MNYLASSFIEQQKLQKINFNFEKKNDLIHRREPIFELRADWKLAPSPWWKCHKRRNENFKRSDENLKRSYEKFTFWNVDFLMQSLNFETKPLNVVLKTGSYVIISL